MCSALQPPKPLSHQAGECKHGGGAGPKQNAKILACMILNFPDVTLYIGEMGMNVLNVGLQTSKPCVNMCVARRLVAAACFFSLLKPPKLRVDLLQ